jgi:DNA-directed RNA polymerase subunit alpha
VGRRTDYDKLTVDVETNGAIDPERAIAQAAEILRTHFQYFLSFEMPGEEMEGELEAKHNRFKELFARPVDELELSVRSGNCLKASNIRTLGDLVQKSESEMLQFRNFGKKSLNEISDILQRHGLTFGMSVRRNPTSGDYEVQDREELRRLPDVQLWDEEEELDAESRDGGEDGGEEE